MTRVAEIEDNSKHYNYAFILYTCNTCYANSTLNETTKTDLFDLWCCDVVMLLCCDFRYCCDIETLN